MPERLLLLDSASLYFRAFYGVPDRRRPGQPPNNAIRGFADMIATLVGAFEPTHLVACWDNDWRPQFRVDAIASYKAHRVVQGTDADEESPDDLTPQVPVIAELLAAAGIARLGLDGYEADDVIGTLTQDFLGRGAVDVVTGDRDLFQLVDDELSVRVVYTAKGGVRDPDLVSQSYLQAKYAVPSGPAYADMAVLRGDSSDGLPGVAGIGEKTAATLISEFGSLAGIRQAVADGDPRIKGARRTRLEAASDYLDVAPGVVNVVRDIPLPAAFDSRLPGQVRDLATLDQIARDYDATTPIERLVDALTR